MTRRRSEPVKKASPFEPRAVRALREHLDESREAFGARFCVSPRTVEDWEQGRRRPQALTLKALLDLLKQYQRNGTRTQRA